MKQRNVIRFILILIVLLAACSNENNQLAEENEIEDSATENQLENNENKEVNNSENNEINEIAENNYEEETFQLVDMNAELLPNNIQEVMDFPVGKFEGESFSEDNKAFMEEVDALPSLHEEASEEELENYIYQVVSLYAANYPDPRQLINRWEQLSFGTPEVEEDSRYEMKENLNVEILLDSSGSMSEEIDGTPKMDIAKEAITEFVEELPEEANVSLRVYGHIGESQEVSCERVDRVYDLQPYEEEAFGETLEEFFPNGWTPIAKAVEDTHEDYQDLSGEENTNLIYLVSDGIETCGGDPVKAAEELGQSEIMPIVNIIGFDVPSDEQQQLKDMASAAEGVYAVADDQDQLKEELSRGNEMASAWLQWKGEMGTEISVTRGEQANEIIEERNSWRKKIQDERISGSEIMSYLKSGEKLTEEQRKKAYDMVNDRYRAIYDMGEEVYGLLYDDNKENHSKMREQMEELYEEQETD
ncbi:VWA domain-containing protein [Salipaludibacillus sp. HK11]|uniref:VWA domain-containing protein n=1 Tax=Salipaludibacillus sp. HK11 TaxID=3394320 RepID=UPI0039FC99C0